MRASVTLKLANKESYRLFTKSIGQGDALVERAHQKINAFITLMLQENPLALTTLYQWDELLQETSEYFFDEQDKYEGQLEKCAILGKKIIQIKHSYEHTAHLSNPLSLHLIECIEIFDKLISSLKLLNLSGAFESIDTFYQMKRINQKKLNRILSTISLHPLPKVAKEISTPNSEEHAILQKALQSPIASGINKSTRDLWRQSAIRPTEITLNANNP